MNKVTMTQEGQKSLVMDRPTAPIESYAKGKPCMLGEVIGRIVGNAEEGSWGEINGVRIFSVPLFGTPHGSVIKTGVLHLIEIDIDSMNKLRDFEDELISSGKELYAGKLDDSKDCLGSWSKNNKEE